MTKKHHPAPTLAEFNAVLGKKKVKEKAERKAEKKTVKARKKLLAKMKSKEKLAEIMRLIHTEGGGDGDHHMRHLIDQIVRVVQGDNYDKWRYDFEYGDGQGGYYSEKFYEWDEGIP